jgi:hypothetical protein
MEVLRRLARAKASMKEAWSIPNIQLLLIENGERKAKFFVSGYFHLPVEDNSRSSTAFITPLGYLNNLGQSLIAFLISSKLLDNSS